MSDVPSWVDKIDFALLVEDGAGRVALFYVNGVLSAVPGSFLQALSEEDYNRVTAFLLDELQPTTQAVVEEGYEWARRDAVRGVFVYTFKEGASEFIRAAAPATPVLRRDMSGLGETKLVLKLATLDFARDRKCRLQD
jgi:hypothetical protein